MSLPDPPIIDYATPTNTKPLPISKLATTSLVAPLLYRLAIWAWPGEDYHLFSNVPSLTLQLCLNILFRSAPYALFAAIGILATIRQPASVDPRSRLVALAGIPISAATAYFFWQTVYREYLYR